MQWKTVKSGAAGKLCRVTKVFMIQIKVRGSTAIAELVSAQFGIVG
jgi:hypothetical protein